MNGLNKLGKIYNRLEEYLMVTLVAITTLIVFYQVVMRYGFNSSPSWSEEIARFMFVWETWLGISLTQKYGKHIKIEVLIGKLEGMRLCICNIASDIITFLICTMLATYGYKVMDVIWTMGQTSSGAHIPIWIVYLACPLSCSLMMIRLFADLAEQFRNIKNSRKELV